VNVEHKFSEKFLVGATFLKMTEKPFTQKSNYGQESVNNTIFGANVNYSTEVPFFTRMVNKLPNIDTDVPSNLSVRAEIAFLKPDTPKADKFEGESTIYVDDFEGSQTTIDMRSPYSWSLSSVPVHDGESDYPDFGADLHNNIASGNKRAKLSWYSIDPTFYAQTPGELSAQDIGFNATRRIFSEELYPQTDIAEGQSQVVNTFDLSYYPTERGPYNYNPAAAATNGFSPADAVNNFGGIVRAINSTNFEQANVEYIQFWMMDPYYDSGNETNPDAPIANVLNTGKMYFDLGAISEDVLDDGRKQYENGLGGNAVIVSNVWGNLPASQSLIYAFDTDAGNRAAQSIESDAIKEAQHPPKAPALESFPDPTGDNYQYLLSANGSVLDRYKQYNGTQGNSPVDISNDDRGSTTLPDVEDINRDNTMNTINAYYEYSIDLHKNITRADRYVTDIREESNLVGINAINLPPGAAATKVRWIQYKIPISVPENTIGGISDFRTINFMRIFMTGFNNNITVRFGALDLVRGEWRRYTNTLDQTDVDPDDDDTSFDVQAVNIQENGDRSPISYVSPPGVVREELINGNSIIQQNEQSLSLRTCDLQPGAPDPIGTGDSSGDARAVFKNVSVDMRQFKRLKMFLHAESLADVTAPVLQNDEMIGFIRFGNDFTENFYEVEIPLKVTAPNATTEQEIWPEENEIDLSLELLTQLKILAMGSSSPVADANGIKYMNEGDLNPSLAGRPNELRLGIRGNPNFGLVRTLMVGIKNNTYNPQIPTGVASNPHGICGEVWFNELRLSEMDNKGGMAAVVNLDTNLADFATVSAVGKMSTIGFGSLEQGPNERSREDIKQYNIVTNLNLGKLLPKKWGITLPFNYAIGEETITPEYDPLNQDIRLDQLLDNTADADERERIENRAVDYTKRKSINFIGVRKERGEKQKPHVYDPENLTLSYSFNEVEHHDFEIENFLDQQINTTVDYAYTFQPKAVEPFKKNKFMKKSSYWKLLSDFNFNYLPSSISFNTNIMRQYNKQQFRQVQDVDGIGIDPLYRRNFLFNYQYGFNYSLTKSLKINYTVATNNIVRNYVNPDGTPDNSITIWDDYFEVGEANHQTQQIVINYELPINKIPVFSFIKANYSYTGDYN
jgi:cell surface protein SprA